MARPRKLTRTAVRAIFRSPATAAEIAPRYNISTALVSQIRQKRRYRDLTRGLEAPRRRRSRGRREDNRRRQRDTVKLTWLVDAVVNQLMNRIRRPMK